MDNIIINGNVYVAAGTTAAALRVELWDETGNYGLVSRDFTKDDGAFSFLISDTTEQYMLDGTLIPKVQIYYRDTLIGEANFAYNPGVTVDVVADDAIYHQALTNSGESQFRSSVSDITNTRLEKAAVFNNLTTARNALQKDTIALQQAQSYGLDTSALQNSINVHQDTVNTLSAQYVSLHDQENSQVEQYCEFFEFHNQVVGQLDDHVPVLFFPVRVETVFQQKQGYELWVRIFPDDIAVDTHEQDLTADEITAGQQYWTTYVTAAGNNTNIQQAWDLVCRSFGAQRAAWVTLKTKPTNLGTATAANIAFPILAPKPYSWGKQPVTKIMPDRFVIIGYQNEDYQNPVFSVQTNPIADILPMGIDPSAANDSFVQQNGDITTPNNDVDWMVDFNAAVTKGMGKKITLSAQQFKDGFCRIIVLGVKASLDKDASKDRLEELIDSHHYTDGFSILKQNTSTSNTPTEYSGYSSVDFGNGTTMATERQAALFTPTPYNVLKTDGQLLCEALGIDYDNLYHIYESNGYDIRDAMNINNALFQVAIGYYAGTMMQPHVSSQQLDELRDFYTDYVRSRGALPGIRSGIQPYGILPASVYSRIAWYKDPYRDIYTNISWLSGKLSPHWAGVIANAPDPQNTTEANQRLLSALGQPAVSTGRIQRIGVGAGYIWNNLVYASPSGNQHPHQWINQQNDRIQILKDNTEMPLIGETRIAQTNFLEKQTLVTRPVVAGPEVHPGKVLPKLGSSSMNYLQLLATATFTQIRDENYSAYGIAPDLVPDAQLYQYARQSLLLEYHSAACKLIGVDDKQRTEAELVNMPVSGGTGNTGYTLYAGENRWKVLSKPYGGYTSVAAYLDSGAANEAPAAAYLIRTRNSLMELGDNTVSQLDLLTNEVMDVSSHRLDAWQLALTNQRINALRNITDGDLARDTGIFIGAYGWVENVHNRGNRTVINMNDSNFTGVIEEDSSNKGYVQAPSISQAAAAAVLRSGYVNNGGSSSSSQFAVNISSERVRHALPLLDGINNGQEIAVMLGYEFERRLQDLYAPATAMAQFIEPLREKFYLTNKIDSITPDGTTVSNTNKATNVVNGTQIIATYKASGISTVVAGLGTNSTQQSAIENEIKWIANLVDAIGDLMTAESVFQLIQGNPARSSAVTDAASRGSNIPEMQHIDSLKTGLSVYQRFTLHLENDTNAAAGWNNLALTARAQAEPFLNRWAGQLLGDPTKIKCTINNITDNTQTEISLADLGIQALDFVYMITDVLVTDNAELPLRIKRYARANNLAIATDVLDIEYDNNVTGNYSFAEMLPLTQYFKQVITNSRPLKTTDYVAPAEADGVDNIYDLSDLYNRVTAAGNDFLSNFAGLPSSATAGNATQVRSILDSFTLYGLEQTIYEYNDNNTDDLDILTAYLGAVKIEGQKRIDAYNLAVPAPPPTPALTGTAIDDYVNKCVDAIRALFGREFNILPFFQLRTVESNLCSSLLNNGLGTLLNDHSTNNFLMDEWVSGIAKVRKNTAAYEMLSILASVIEPKLFDGDRFILPLQIPYDNGGTERWLGASVNVPADALKDGRVALGVSGPDNGSGFDITGWQVGIMIDEWIDVVPNPDEATGIAFHFNQPNAKPPQCLLLGLTPDITGTWQWDDMVDMINETFDLAKQRGVTYEQISSTPVGQVSSAFMVPFTAQYSTIGFTANDLQQQ